MKLPVAGSRYCVNCQTALPPDVPDGFCPICEFRGALDLSLATAGEVSDVAAAPSGSLSVAGQLSALERIRFFNDYELLEEIARGGMGVVFKARQISLNRTVALKMILAGPLASRDFVQRFKTETEAAARLDHPNIVPIFEVGESGGQHYYSMKLVEGVSLAEGIASGKYECRVAGRDGARGLHAVAMLMAKVARAVHYAHQRGILHRDLKPGNILVDSQGEPYVTDFGLAKILDQDSGLTNSHMVLGTASYMAPEQAAGGAKDLSTAADVYSLGAMMYELLTGEVPFHAPTPLETMRLAVENAPRRPSSSNRLVDRDLETICLKCLAKNPSHRYGSAEALADDLDRWHQGEPIHARPVNSAEKFWSWCRRKPALATSLSLILTLLLIVIIGSPIAVFRINRARQNETLLRQQADRRAYASDMNLVQRALEMHNIGSALNLLNRYRPTGKSETQNPSSETDLRGWEWRYLWGQCQSDADTVFRKNTNAVVSLSVSDDGAWLAAGLSKIGVVIWDLETRLEIARLPASGQMVRVAFSPRERLLAYSDVPNYGSSSTNFSIHLWDGATQQIVRTLSLDFQCYGVAFSEDGRTLVTSTQNPRFNVSGAITLWRVSDGSKLAKYMTSQRGGNQGTPFALAGDLSIAAFAADDTKVCVIDLATGQQRWEHSATDDIIMGLALSPDGKILASGAGYADSVIRLWEVASGRELGRLEGHRAGIHQLIFFPDGKTLASAGHDQTIRLWNVTDPANGRELNILQGHRSWVRAIALLPDNTLASGSEDRTVCLWNTVATRKERTYVTLPIFVGPWRFAPDSQSVVVLNEDPNGANPRMARSSRVTDFQEMQLLCELGTNVVDEACLSRDGRWVAASYSGGEVKVWDLQSRSQSCEFTVPAKRALPREFLAGGKKLMILDDADNSLHEWDLETRRETRSWSPPQGRWTYAFSPNGHYCLASILNPDTKSVTSLLELNSGRETNLNPDWYYAASFSPDGRFFAFGGWGNDVRLWETANQKEIAKLNGILGQVRGVGFSPDSKRFVTGDCGKEAVTLWDMESREKLLTLEGRGSFFDDIAFSPDGNVLAARNWGGGLHLWRAPSWEEIDAVEKARTDDGRLRSSP